MIFKKFIKNKKIKSHNINHYVPLWNPLLFMTNSHHCGCFPSQHSYEPLLPKTSTVFCELKVLETKNFNDKIHLPTNKKRFRLRANSS